MRGVEVHVGRLKLLEDFYVLDMVKGPTCRLLVGRGFLATASAIIDCKKSKIAVGEGYTRSVFEVNEIDQGKEEVSYWTTQARRKSYYPRPNTNIIGTQTPFYLESDFINSNATGEREIAKDAELNPFKDILVFRKMVEFLGAIQINLKGNMWESKDMFEKKLDWNKPPKV
ncbi:hypothetical protein Tco_1079709 [Tanacetum coccineum]|uniref:Uncharacterized protein n=1 Tax=Tanacetum coccineum TaxID=301880 RepID=A0ABQ5HSU5_9ASTR